MTQITSQIYQYSDIEYREAYADRVRPIGTVLYASGERGLNVRADGKGGSLLRGYYKLTENARLGPFKGKREATEAFLCLECIEQLAKRMDPRDVPHDDVDVSLCEDCYAAIAEELKEELQDEIDSL